MGEERGNFCHPLEFELVQLYAKILKISRLISLILKFEEGIDWSITNGQVTELHMKPGPCFFLPHVPEPLIISPLQSFASLKLLSWLHALDSPFSKSLWLISCWQHLPQSPGKVVEHSSSALPEVVRIPQMQLSRSGYSWVFLHN